MDFDLDVDQQRYKNSLCDFLSAALTPKAWAEQFDPSDMTALKPSFIRALFKEMGGAGLIGASWPKQYGGQAKSALYDCIFAEELEYHGLPLMPGVTYIPPILISTGTEEQKNSYLPRLRAGDIQFFLGYSEPNAGSDLGSLRTQAVPRDGGYVITGEKLFSSYANFAEYGWVAARTDPNVPKHKGISLFIVDMRTPGINVHGHRTISGWLHPAVTFEDAWVPAANMVGQVNQGWYLIMHAIELERAGVGNSGRELKTFERILEYCRHTLTDGKPLIKDPIVRQKLAEAAMAVESMRLLAYEVGDCYSRGERAEHQANLLMLVKKETQRMLDRLGMEILGPFSQFTRGSSWAPFDGAIELAYKDNLRATFSAGGLDITRNILATRVLGLPRS